MAASLRSAALVTLALMLGSVSSSITKAVDDTGEHEDRAAAALGLVSIDGRQRPRGRLLGEVEPKLIKGPLNVVSNCPKCTIQAIPEMCKYMTGTEPPGARWEDYQGEGAAKAADAQLQPPASEPKEAEGHKEDEGADNKGGQGKGGWLVGAAAEESGKAGEGASMQQRLGGRGFLGSVLSKLKSDRPQNGLSRALLATRRVKRSIMFVPKVSARQAPFVQPSKTIEDMVRKVLDKWKANPWRCGIWTKECVRRYVAGDSLGLSVSFANKTAVGRAHPLKKIINPQGKLPENFIDLFPDLQPGSLGSCAVVAVGDNMLHAGRGAQIDAHDTVFRYNAPMKRFTGDVGKKSDVVYWKMRKDEKDYGQEGQTASRFYTWKDSLKFWEFGKKSDWETQTFKGKPLLWPNLVSSEIVSVYHPYFKEHKVREGGVTAAGGFKLAIDVLASGLCKRIDLYGFTARGSAKYFKREAFMKSRHISGLEHWVYREAQAKGMMCVYD